MNRKVFFMLLSLLMTTLFSGIVFAEYDSQYTALEDQYKSILDLYAEGETVGWGTNEYQERGLSVVVGYGDSTMGYCFYDINSDGITEMLVTTTLYNDFSEEDLQYGTDLYGIYTIYNGEPYCIATGTWKTTYHICGDGAICMMWSYSAFHSAWRYSELTPGGATLEEFLEVAVDGGTYGDNPNSDCYISKEYPFDEGTRVITSEEEMNSVVNSYSYLFFRLTPITDYMDRTHFTDNASTIPSDPYTIPFYGIWCLGTKDYEEAYSYANDLQNMGYPAQVYMTTEWSNLNQEPWWVVAAAQCQNESEAEDNLAWVRQVCPDAYIKWSGDYIGGP